MPTPADYPLPVDRLFTFGIADVSTIGAWPNYLELGLGPGHIPALIQLATDDTSWQGEPEEDDPALSASIHAWRALGRLRAVSAVLPVLGLRNGRRPSQPVSRVLCGRWLRVYTTQGFVLAASGPAIIYLGRAVARRLQRSTRGSNETGRLIAPV